MKIFKYIQIGHRVHIYTIFICETKPYYYILIVIQINLNMMFQKGTIYIILLLNSGIVENDKLIIRNYTR